MGDIAVPMAVYNAAGQRVSKAMRGVSLVRQSDGTVKKVLRLRR